MATTAEKIATIKAQTLARIAEITANPKPNYSIDGQSVSWASYLETLQRTVEWCDKTLAQSDPWFEEQFVI